MLVYYVFHLGKKPRAVDVPVICVGNAITGGSGKTPTVMAVIELLRDVFPHMAVVSRGYGGDYQGVHVVNEEDTAEQIGDEACLIRSLAPVYLSSRRYDAALKACEDGADAIIMDDGLQHKSLFQDMGLLVMKQGVWFGNGFVMPSGPLREPLTSLMNRVAAIIYVIYDDDTTERETFMDRPIFKLTCQLSYDIALRGKTVLAFSGIAFPDLFYEQLISEGIDVAHTISFADHHPYEEHEIEALIQEALEMDAFLVTTEKDAVRIPKIYHADLKIVRQSRAFNDPERVRLFIKEHLNQRIAT